MTVSPVRCHLRPSDKKRLAAIDAANRAAAEQCALDEHINLLKVTLIDTDILSLLSLPRLSLSFWFDADVRAYNISDL